MKFGDGNKGRGVVVAMAALLWGGGTAAHALQDARPFTDYFSSYGTEYCYGDGETFGPWTSRFSSYGCNEVRLQGGMYYLRLNPQAPPQADQTRASLVTGPAFKDDYAMSVEVRTARQLRKGSPANSWEVAWLIWNFTDNDHFYYFIPKTNGWELGKRDPDYPGGQRFLGTGTQPFPLESWHRFRIEQKQNTMSLYCNNALVTTFTDHERPYIGGRIGFYSEDADAHFRNITVEGVTLTPAFPDLPTDRPLPDLPGAGERPVPGRDGGIAGLLGGSRRRGSESVTVKRNGRIVEQTTCEWGDEGPSAATTTRKAMPPKLGGSMSFSISRYYRRESQIRRSFNRTLEAEE